jgi:DnaB-like helicase C terminal domain
MPSMQSRPLSAAQQEGVSPIASQYETVFIQHLTIEESFRLVLEAHLPPEVFHDEALRSIYEWALNYWHSSAEERAPSPAAMKVHFESVLAEHEIPIDMDPDDTVVWSIDSLRGAYIDRQWQEWVKGFTVDMSTVGLEHKGVVLEGHLDKLMGLSTSLARRSSLVDVREGISDRLDAYHQRALDRQSTTTRGLTIGLAEVDDHTDLIQPGELAVFAAGPKTGKSFALDYAALRHWEGGGTPVLFTLENSVEMTLDRIAAQALGLGIGWSRGEADEGEVMRVEAWIDHLKVAERPFYVISPEVGRRTIEHMVRLGKSLGDAIIIDQLTFVEVPMVSARKARHEQVRDILHELKALISTGQRIPCLLAHQVNREGVKSAEKVGRLEMYHMAEASEVERSADVVFGLWQGAGLRSAGRAYLQILAARRFDLVNWELAWQPWSGLIQARGRIDLSRTDGDD